MQHSFQKVSDCINIPFHYSIHARYALDVSGKTTSSPIQIIPPSSLPVHTCPLEFQGIDFSVIFHSNRDKPNECRQRNEPINRNLLRACHMERIVTGIWEC